MLMLVNKINLLLTNVNRYKFWFKKNILVNVEINTNTKINKCCRNIGYW